AVPGPTWLLIALAVGIGAARGCHTLLQATAVSDRWGTQNFGAINALFNAPMTAVAALAPVSGPPLAGLVGRYPALAILMAVLLTVPAAVGALPGSGAGAISGADLAPVQPEAIIMGAGHAGPATAY